MSDLTQDLLGTIHEELRLFKGRRQHQEMHKSPQGYGRLLTRQQAWVLPHKWQDYPGDSEGKESACNAGNPGSSPGSGRSPGEGNAAHSSIRPWRIPWTVEPGGLQSVGSQRVLKVNTFSSLSLFGSSCESSKRSILHHHHSHFHRNSFYRLGRSKRVGVMGGRGWVLLH